MELNLELRCSVKFLFKLGEIATETFDMSHKHVSSSKVGPDEQLQEEDHASGESL